MLRCLVIALAFCTAASFAESTLPQAAYELQFEQGYLTDPAVQAAETRLMAAVIYQARQEGTLASLAEETAAGDDEMAKLLSPAFVRKLQGRGVSASEFARQVMAGDFSDTQEMNSAAGSPDLSELDQRRAESLLRQTVLKTGATLPDGDAEGDEEPEARPATHAAAPEIKVVEDVPAVAAEDRSKLTVLQRARLALGNRDLTDEQAILEYSKRNGSKPVIAERSGIFQKAHRAVAELRHSRKLQAHPFLGVPVIALQSAPQPSLASEITSRALSTARGRRRVLGQVFADVRDSKRTGALGPTE